MYGCLPGRCLTTAVVCWHFVVPVQLRHFASTSSWSSSYGSNYQYDKSLGCSDQLERVAAVGVREAEEASRASLAGAAPLAVLIQWKLSQVAQVVRSASCLG